MLNYQIAGNGPPLLLVHGFGISFNIWRNILPLLEQHFTLVMVQLPGIGDSPPPPESQSYLLTSIQGIEQIRRKLGYETLDVLGYSIGSRVAEAYIRSHPEHVGRVIFLCPIRPDPPQLRGLQVGFWFNSLSTTTGSWFLRGWRLRFLIFLFGFSLSPHPLLEEWHKEMESLPVEVLKASLQTSILSGGQPFQVPVPAYFIWGDQDLVAASPRRLGAKDFIIHSSHAAPMLAAGDVSRTILDILGREFTG